MCPVFAFDLQDALEFQKVEGDDAQFVLSDFLREQLSAFSEFPNLSKRVFVEIHGGEAMLNRDDLNPVSVIFYLHREPKYFAFSEVQAVFKAHGLELEPYAVSAGKLCLRNASDLDLDSLHLVAQPASRLFKLLASKRGPSLYPLQSSLSLSRSSMSNFAGCVQRSETKKHVIFINLRDTVKELAEGRARYTHFANQLAHLVAFCVQQGKEVVCVPFVPEESPEQIARSIGFPVYSPYLGYLEKLSALCGGIFTPIVYLSDPKNLVEIAKQRFQEFFTGWTPQIFLFDYNLARIDCSDVTMSALVLPRGQMDVGSRKKLSDSISLCSSATASTSASDSTASARSPLSSPASAAASPRLFGGLNEPIVVNGEKIRPVR